MLKILIINKVNYHYEILESLFTIFLKKIFPSKLFNEYEIYMFIYKNTEYENYILSKYKNIIFLKDTKNLKFDIEIYATTYPKHIKDIKNDSYKYYISHRVDKELSEFKNVFFLTPLCLSDKYIIPTTLPEIIKKETKIPIFCIQGNIDEKRRNFKSLIPIFENFKNRTFRIKIIGKGDLPSYLLKYKNKIILENNHDFLKYHECFDDVYILMTLIDDTFEHNYFTNQLTSSVTYGISYNIPLLIFSKLNDIYKDELKNSIVYNNQNEMNLQFKNLLNKFYNDKKI